MCDRCVQRQAGNQVQRRTQEAELHLCAATVCNKQWSRWVLRLGERRGKQPLNCKDV